MTDLDNTQIIATDESFIQNSSNIESVSILVRKKLFLIN